MGLRESARRLELVRGMGAVAVGAAASLVYTSPGVIVDRSGLRPGDRVVCDYVLVERRWPVDPDLALRRERVTRDAADSGCVVDADGVVIGRVLRGRRGGVLLEYAAAGA